MATVTRIEVSKFAEKQLSRLPNEIREAYYIWARSVEKSGIHAVRLSRGYRDEALKGNRQGQRSARLNRAYRVIYEQFNDGECVVIGVVEVNKHEY